MGMGRSSSCNNLGGRLWRWREAGKIKGYLEMYVVRIWQLSEGTSEVSSFCHWVSTRHRKKVHEKNTLSWGCF